MVTIRVQSLHAMASFIPHDSCLQEAISFLPLFSILKNMYNHGRDDTRASHTSRLYPGSIRDALIKKVDVDLYTVCFS